MDLFRDGASDHDDVEDFQANIPVVYLGDLENLAGENDDEDEERNADFENDENQEDVSDEDGFDHNQELDDFYGIVFQNLPNQEPNAIQVNFLSDLNANHEGILAIDESEENLMTIKSQLLDLGDHSETNLDTQCQSQTKGQKEISIHFKMLSVSGLCYNASSLSNSTLRHKSQLDSINGKNVHHNQCIILKLNQPAIVTKLTFDEKFLEKIALMETVDLRHSQVSSLELHASTHTTVTHKVNHCLRMFWYLMRTVKFYGGLTEDCPIKLTASYSDITVCPQLVTLPTNSTTLSASTIGTVTSSADSGPRSSAFSRVLRQFQLSHTIGGQPFPCAYIKLVLPSRGSMLSTRHISSSLSSSSEQSAVYSGINHFHLYPMLNSSRGSTRGPSSSQSSMSAANAQKHQQLFQCKAWQMFVRVLTYQDRHSNRRQCHSSLDSGCFLDVIGVVCPDELHIAQRWLAEFSMRQSIRVTLKYFRKHNLMAAFEATQRETGQVLEHPRIAELFDLFVKQADYEATERFLTAAKEDGLFEQYIRSGTPYKTEWQLLTGGATNVRSSFAMFSNLYSQPGVPVRPLSPGPATPRMRAGHAMVIDQHEQHIYLFGGFDGTHELNDLWRFDIQSSRWTELPHTAHTPPPCSCHQMCFDPKQKRIYLLGRYVDYDQANDFKSPLYMYLVGEAQWYVLQKDTYLENGPQLLCNHQMCIDSEKNRLYVFGGLIQSSESRTTQLSDFFVYDISYDEWQLLRFDQSLLPQMLKPVYSNQTYARVLGQFGQAFAEKTFYSRVGHAMVFHSKQRRLYVIGGHRLRSYFHDVLVYDVDQDKMETLSDVGLSFSADHLNCGCTIRANLDENTDEIFIYSILTLNCPNEDKLFGSSNRSQGVLHIVDQQQRSAEGQSNGPDSGICPMIRRQSRFGIKNHFWILDLKYQTLSCCYRNEKCYNPDGSICERSGDRCGADDYFDLHNELLHQLEDDEYLMCNYLNESALHAHILNVLNGIEDPLQPVVPLSPPQNQPPPQAIPVAPAAIPVDVGQVGPVNPVPELPNNNNNGQPVNLEQPNQPPFLNFSSNLLNVVSVSNHIPTTSIQAPSTKVSSTSTKVEYSGVHRPRPRYATQLVFNSTDRSHYLFGGNQNRLSNNRCDDLWMCKMKRNQAENVLFRLVRQVRRLHYMDLVSQNRSIEAVSFLRNKLTILYDKKNTKESNELNKLIKILFDESSSPLTSQKNRLDVSENCDFSNVISRTKESLSFCKDSMRMSRSEAFDEMMKYFPQDMTQPKESLNNLILSSVNKNNQVR